MNDVATVLPEPRIDFDREHAEDLARGLPSLVLDRQRVIHSAAFRRLQYKTQVFLSLEGDHFRTRLTHTLEVAHLARCIAATHHLDEQLAEVVALAHDLGHPPFGHAGERALDECMAGCGGFNHNAHSLRVVEYLEHPYPQFRGLNLTRVVRECLAKHETRYDAAGTHPLNDGTPAPLEGQAAALADRLAYTLHDLQDGLFAGLLSPEDLRPLRVWQDACWPAACPENVTPASWLGLVRSAVDSVQSYLLARVQKRCENVRRREGETVHSRDPIPLAHVSTVPPNLLCLSADADAALAELEALLLERVYRNAKIAEADRDAARVVRELFHAYVADPSRLPPRFARRVDQQGAPRVAADYIAGMTDRFALAEHAKL